MKGEQGGHRSEQVAAREGHVGQPAWPSKSRPMSRTYTGSRAQLMNATRSSRAGPADREPGGPTGSPAGRRRGLREADERLPGRPKRHITRSMTKAVREVAGVLEQGEQEEQDQDLRQEDHGACDAADDPVDRKVADAFGRRDELADRPNRPSTSPSARRRARRSSRRAPTSPRRRPEPDRVRERLVEAVGDGVPCGSDGVVTAHALGEVVDPGPTGWIESSGVGSGTRPGLRCGSLPSGVDASAGSTAHGDDRDTESFESRSSNEMPRRPRDPRGRHDHRGGGDGSPRSPARAPDGVGGIDDDERRIGGVVQPAVEISRTSGSRRSRSIP